MHIKCGMNMYVRRVISKEKRYIVFLLSTPTPLIISLSEKAEFISASSFIPLPSMLPVVVLFQEAILFGLSHETAFTEASVSTTHSFPFATVERTVS